MVNEEVIEKCIKSLRGNYNLILTGAPGTGKTYLAKLIAETIGAEYEIVQFHPSYDYTNFVEGLRPVTDVANVTFVRKDGVFKEFCKKAIDASVDIDVVLNNPIERERIFDSVYAGIAKDIKEDKLILESKGASNDKTRSKYTYVVNEVGQIRPINDGDLNGNKKGAPKNKIYELVSYYLKNPEEWKNESKDKFNEIIASSSIEGKYVEYYVWPIVKEMLDRISLQSEKPYVFIIDEINRGELSRIFGELFYAIDAGYRGVSGKVKTQYQSMVPQDDVFSEGFYVPKNVFIIGTMNDIDRSVESMDFAIRRRFAWQEISVKMFQNMLYDDRAWACKKPSLDVLNELKVRMDNLNNAIIDKYLEEELASRDRIGLSCAYQLGASYFLKYGLYGNFEDLWEFHIKGILCEYLRGAANAEDKLVRLKNAFNDKKQH